MSIIIPGKLYLGGALDAAFHDTFITTHRITHILNCTNEVGMVYPTSVIGYRIALEDDNPEGSNELLKKGAEVLKQWLNDPDAIILVHCFAGMSRSVSVIIAYLVIDKNYTVRDAVKYLSNRRPFIRPFKGFLNEIRVHETYKAKLFSCLTPKN